MEAGARNEENDKVWREIGEKWKNQEKSGAVEWKLVEKGSEREKGRNRKVGKRFHDLAIKLFNKMPEALIKCAFCGTSFSFVAETVNVM